MTTIHLAKRIFGDGADYRLTLDNGVMTISHPIKYLEAQELYRSLAFALGEQTAEEAVESCAEEETRLKNQIRALRGALTKAKRRRR